MAVRIYSLAKDLKLDSKELVDLCTRIGITNKGSALASLDDDEVGRIKKYLSGGEAKAAAPAAPEGYKAPPAPIAPPSRTPQIIRPRRDPNAPISAAPKAPAPTPPPADLATQVVAESAPAPALPSTPAPVPVVPESTIPPVETPTIAATSAETEAPSVAESNTRTPGFSRSEYVRPAASGSKVRVIGQRPKAGATAEAKPATEERAKKRREPVINLNVARIPKSGQAPQQQKSNEPAPQKPEIKLTPDVLSGHKKGMTAPLEDVIKREEAKHASARTAAVAATGGLKDFKDASDKAKVRGKTRQEEDDEQKGRRKLAVKLATTGGDRNKRRRGKPGEYDSSGEDDRRNRRRTLIRKGNNTAAPRKERTVCELPCTVRSLSEAGGIPAARVLHALMSMGTMANINAALDDETAHLVATELGLDVEFRSASNLEDDVIQALETAEDNPEDMVARPPIVTFLGHVDHGKTSLLDYLIGTNVVSGEAGGITQHIRAYQVATKDGRKVSFVDTPGHEAFTEMRARGANVTDIAVLVIAADDGIMPQTEEAISHAKAAGVPIVVALNKMDLPGADPSRVMTQLTEHGLTPSEWGGDVEIVRTSAITGAGMDELLETLLGVAELHEYTANPKRPATGVCLEAEQAADRGVIAKLMVNAGTLKPGQVVICGSSFGRIKAIYDTMDINKSLSEAGPSMPVNVTGLSEPPAAGDRFYVLEDVGQAREIAESRSDQSRAQSLAGHTTKVSFENFQEMLQSGQLGQKEERVELNLIIRADVRGSLEAIEKELSKLDHPEVLIRTLQRSVGGISVADVTLATASHAVIIGFNVIPDEAARNLADERNVEIRRYNIIYKLAEDIKALIEGRLRPEKRIIELGRALVKQVFSISRVGTIAGCYVAQGTIERGCRIRVNRDGRTIGDYALDSVRRVKEDVKEVPRGMECGIKLSGFNDIKQDDVLEAYKIEEFARTLDIGGR